MTEPPDDAFLEPRIVALAWVQFAIGRGRLDLVWPITEPIGRLCMAQDWVHRNWGLLEPSVASRDDLIADLATEKPRGVLAGDFFRDRGAYLQRTYAGTDIEQLTAGQRHRLLGPDLEVVLLIDKRDLGIGEDGESCWLSGTYARTLPIAMRLVGRRWLVHALGIVWEPGWPPTVVHALAAE